MELVEIRDLDGPNLFLLEPSIKIEFRGEVDDELPRRVQTAISAIGHVAPPVSGLDAARELIAALHESVGVSPPSVAILELETPKHSAVVFGWEHRRFALALAQQVARIVTGDGDWTNVAELRAIHDLVDPDDEPLWIRDLDRSSRIVSVTGTNGKTTTTRLISHVVASAGLSVGWSSSSGVYVDGVELVRGDYSGPSGARQVLAHDQLDVAVLETARGGVLLRGVAYESNDVSVFTNVSADHLDLQGIHTVGGLARVKAVVCRITRPDGVSVVNADDLLVLNATKSIRARRLFVSSDDANPAVVAHLMAGGTAVFVRDGEFVAATGDDEVKLLPVVDAPITLGGQAPHMIENALCAIGGCLGLGIDPEAVASGLRSFSNSPEHNRGRLNLFEVHGFTVLLDFAHNEAGLSQLLALSHRLKADGGRVICVVGTAGDRTAASLVELGRIAATESDVVIVKETEKYLRGRTNAEMNRLYVDGMAAAGLTDYTIEPDELTAVREAMRLAAAGDVVAIMAHEQVDELVAFLEKSGTPAD